MSKQHERPDAPKFSNMNRAFRAACAFAFKADGTAFFGRSAMVKALVPRC